MQGLVTHRGEHATAEQEVPGSVGETQRKQHLAAGVRVHSAVVGHPSEIEREFCNRRHQPASDPFAVLAVEEGGHLLAEVCQRHRQCCAAAERVVNLLEVSADHAEASDLPDADSPSVRSLRVVGRSDLEQPVQGRALC